MAETRTRLREDLDAISFGVVDIESIDFASYVQKFVYFGSKRYQLSIDNLTVFSVHDDDFTGKSDVKFSEVNGEKIPIDLRSHLLAGTKFLDAVLYMHLPNSEKPRVKKNPARGANGKVDVDQFNDPTEIAKCMFFYYFYVLTRARAPEESRGSDKQPVPRFLDQVLSIKKTAGEVADYLASFKLTDLDPAWVRGIQIDGLSREALARFGLGVAGYRLAAPFKLQDPDKDGHDQFAAAVRVARSFATMPSCWDFHPATRNPNLLQKYGNINKNLGNLILNVYKPETIQKFVVSRTLFEIPKEDANHTNYKTWTDQLIYSTSAPIFPSS